jgi:L-threonylcarbamoyladenylate synthase
MQVISGLDGRIDAVMDGGTSSLSIESTIVDLTGDVPKILRRGGLAEELIWSVIREEGCS